MTKISNKFNSLAQIKFVEDIDQEAAANYSGGADIELYSDSDFKGSLTIFNAPIGVTGVMPADTNDTTSSVIINAGQWELYSDSGNGGNVIFVGPGRYNRVDPKTNDTISSAKRVG